MPDTSHSSEDVSRSFSSAPEQPHTPAKPNVDYGAPGVPRPAAEDPHRNKHLPQTASPTSAWNQNALNQTAEKIGTLIGTAVNIVKSVQRQLQSVPDNVVSIRERVRERSQEFRQDAAEAAREWRQTAQARAQRARERTAQYVQENPFHVIVALAGVAFCVGVALRVWRSNLD